MQMEWLIHEASTKRENETHLSLGIWEPRGSSEVRHCLLLSPVLDLCLGEDEVEDQAWHVNSSWKQEDVSPADLWILVAGNHRLLASLMLFLLIQNGSGTTSCSPIPTLLPILCDSWAPWSVWAQFGSLAFSCTGTFLPPKSHSSPSLASSPSVTTYLKLKSHPFFCALISSPAFFFSSPFHHSIHHRPCLFHEVFIAVFSNTSFTRAGTSVFLFVFLFT